MRRIRRVLFVIIILIVVFLVSCNVWVVWSTEEGIYSNAALLPDHRVALVLGTSNKTVSGKPNPYFEKRIETAAKLFAGGKIDHFIVSGDNRSIYYNEPIEMRKALLKKGIPGA